MPHNQRSEDKLPISPKTNDRSMAPRLKKNSLFPTQSCPHCSSLGLELHTMPMWIEVFGKKVPIEGEVLFCPNCDAIWLHPNSKRSFDNQALQYMVRLN